MAVKLKDGSIFLHVPKTGGNWVREILKKNNLVCGEIGHKHSNYNRTRIHETKTKQLSGREHLKEAARAVLKRFKHKINIISPKEKYTPAKYFCFVRDPVTWYESWWKYQETKRGWKKYGDKKDPKEWHPNSTLNGLGSSDFQEFVNNVIEYRPGYVSELLFSYVKPGVHLVGKKEKLRSDLNKILTKINLEYDKEDIKNLKKVNVSKGSDEIRWNKKLLGKVIKTELPAMLHFGYIKNYNLKDLDIETKVNEGLRRLRTKNEI